MSVPWCKRAGWSMLRQSALAAPEITMQARRFAMYGYFRPRELQNTKKKNKMRKPWGAHLQIDEKWSSSIPAVIIKWRPICVPLNVMETLDWWKPHIFLAKSCLNCFQKNMCSFFFLSFFWGKGMQNKQCYTSIAFIPTRKPNWKYTLLPRAQTHYCSKDLLNVEPL
jgi:hypothetical protein